MIRRILIGLLAAAMLLALTACGEKDVQKTPENDKTDTPASDKDPGSGDSDKENPGGADKENPEDAEKPDGQENPGDGGAGGDADGEAPDGEDGWSLPVGAASEYELYRAVMNYLNRGFRAEELRDVCDPALTMAFYSKWEETEDKIFTLGMNQEESCAFIASLRAKAAEMDSPYDETGHIEEDLIDFDAFKEDFPERMQGQIESEQTSYENFIMQMFMPDADFFAESKNPFYTDETSWEVKPEGEYEVKEYHSNDWCDDLYENFPKVYELALGTYISYEATEEWFYYTVIDGRYYFLSFGCAVSGIGG